MIGVCKFDYKLNMVIIIVDMYLTLILYLVKSCIRNLWSITIDDGRDALQPFPLTRKVLFKALNWSSS